MRPEPTHHGTWPGYPRLWMVTSKLVAEHAKLSRRRYGHPERWEVRRKVARDRRRMDRIEQELRRRALEGDAEARRWLG